MVVSGGTLDLLRKVRKSMKQLKLLAVAAPTVALLFSVVTTTTTTDDSSGSGRRGGRVKSEDSALHQSHVNEQEKDARSKGAALLAEAKQEHKAKTAEERLKACQSRKQGIVNRSTRIVAAAKRHQSRITTVLGKGTEFQKTNNLTVPNLDALVDAAAAAQAKSQESIDALAAVQPSVDCNKDSVASDIATFKAAAQQTRSDLKAYKDAVKVVLKAIRDAAPSDDSDKDDASTKDNTTTPSTTEAQ
jgi:uncharacterized protein YaaR (DUF327 family)